VIILDRLGGALCGHGSQDHSSSDQSQLTLYWHGESRRQIDDWSPEFSKRGGDCESFLQFLKKYDFLENFIIYKLNEQITNINEK